MQGKLFDFAVFIVLRSSPQHKVPFILIFMRIQGPTLMMDSY